MSRRIPGRPGGFASRSGLRVRPGEPPDPALRRVDLLRRAARAAQQRVATLDFAASKCGEAGPPVILLLNRHDAERAFALAEARLARAIRAAETKLTPSDDKENRSN